MQTLEQTPKAAAGFAPRLPGAASAELSINANDLRWQLALRIAASGSLGRSQLLSDFLLYIVDRSIRGRSGEITEQQIGVTVFGRAEDYNSNDDNIVRSYARKLRKRIEEYFATEGSCETLRLEIPRGGYTPIFSDYVAISSEVEDKSLPCRETARSEYETSGPAVFEQIESTPPVVANRWHSVAGRIRSARGLFLSLLFGVVLGAGLIFLLHSRPILSQEEAASHTLWTQLFSNKRDTFIVPSDDGLVIMQRLVERPVPLTAYVNGTYRTKLKADNLPDAAEILKLGARRFTNVVDLDFATHLAQLREVVPGRMMIRYARDLRMDDLRTGNAVLIGSDEANPWLQLFRPQLHFCFQFESAQDKPSGFVNLYPRSGENAVYSTSGHEERTFGIIAFLPNLTNSGHVLIVAGLNTAGTQAAAGFLLDPSLMMPTLQRARAANGSLQPFELLVSAGNVATNASTPHLVLERIGLPNRTEDVFAPNRKRIDYDAIRSVGSSITTARPNNLSPQ
jgi:hypothetical protein